jgi:16S rRNA (uracil1498-N3)-methyltransferase
MPTLAFADFLERPTPEGTRVVLVPDGDRSLREITPIAPITVLVGPEGGLTVDERALAVEAGFLAIRFGPRILRSESAPLAALAALQALYGDC